MQNVTKNNYFFNFLKGIGCFLIIFGHFKIPGVVGHIIITILDFTVPVFYMISGYYSYEVPIQVTRKRLKKIIEIFLSSLVCYFICALFQKTLNGTLSQFLNDQLSFNTIIKLVVFCTVDFAVPLWYLIGLIETYALWILIVKFNLQKKSYYLIPILAVCNWVLSTYCDSFGIEWQYKMNFLTCAFSFFLMGVFVRDYQEEFEKIEDRTLIIIGAIGFVIALIPRVCNFKLQFSTVGQLIFAVPVFILAVKHPDLYISKTFGEIGKKYSLDIYIFHLLIGYALSLICGMFIDTESTLFIVIKPFVTGILALIWAMIFYKIKKIIYPKKPA